MQKDNHGQEQAFQHWIPSYTVVPVGSFYVLKVIPYLFMYIIKDLEYHKYNCDISYC